ncbi:hydrophobic surface binding protein A-domain-containing protein [Mycena galericulata]|nr:hydrophobic surface binding protein A-domain-containing protein [Mycena galericulata]
MVYILRFLTVLSIAALGLALSVKRTVAQVEADLDLIDNQMTYLSEVISSFPDRDGSLSGAMAIFDAITDLNTAFNTTTAVVNNNGPLAEDDATIILNSIEALERTTFAATAAIVDKKPSFAALGFITPMYQGFTSQLGYITAFSTALIFNFPSELQAGATTALNNVTVAITVAIAAYSSSSP